MLEGATYCMDCRWLEARTDPSGRTGYWCGLTQDLLGGSVMGLEACGEFEPKAEGMVD